MFYIDNLEDMWICGYLSEVKVHVREEVDEQYDPSNLHQQTRE